MLRKIVVGDHSHCVADLQLELNRDCNHQAEDLVLDSRAVRSCDFVLLILLDPQLFQNKMNTR
jgi:hypothetical protein